MPRKNYLQGSMSMPAFLPQPLPGYARQPIPAAIGTSPKPKAYGHYNFPLVGGTPQHTSGQAPPISLAYQTQHGLERIPVNPTAKNYEEQYQQALMGIGPRGARGISNAITRGAMGTLEGQRIFAVSLNIEIYTIYEQIARSNRQRFSQSGLLGIIRTYFYERLLVRLLGYINSLAPSDSNRLRNAMELSVRGAAGGSSSSISQLNGLNPFEVILSTGIVEYAAVANRMPTPWLQHPGNHGQVKSNRTGRTKHSQFLNDPVAETGWFEKIINLSRNDAFMLWTNLVTHELGMEIVRSGIDVALNNNPDVLVGALFTEVYQ